MRRLLLLWHHVNISSYRPRFEFFALRITWKVFGRNLENVLARRAATRNERSLSGSGNGIVESVVLGMSVGIALFDVNNVKFAFIVLPKLDVERCTSLFVAGAVGDRPSERLKNFVQFRIS
jgi:hypothetical protein